MKPPAKAFRSKKRTDQSTAMPTQSPKPSKSTNKNADESRAQSLTTVFAAADRRTDQWRQLHALSRAWATAPANSDQAESLRADATRTFEAIARLEHCWAYPGPRLLNALSEAIEQRDATSFARLVQKASGALLSGDYRRDDFVWDLAGDGKDRPLDSTLPPDVSRSDSRKPYFEVLVVTPTEPAGWERAKDDMRRLRRGEDLFQYEPVHVGSFEDAAVAVLANDNIQAVVIIDGFQFASRYDRPA